MALSQTDLDVYLQQTGCCAGTEAKELAKQYQYGSECKEEQLEKLTLLNAYVDMLSCYKVQATTATNWVYSISFRDITTLTSTDTIEIFAGGTRLIKHTSNTSTICTLITALADALSEVTGVVSVEGVCSGSDKRIILTLSCAYDDAFAVFNDFTIGEPGSYVKTYLPMEVSTEGKCTTGDDDNCITEEQVETIVENIAILCKKCFKAPGFAYYND